MAASRRAAAAWAAAGILVATGVVVLAVGLATPVTFGWTAYQPLAEATFTPGEGGVFLSRLAVVGLVIITIGLLALAFLLGWRSRAKRRP